MYLFSVYTLFVSVYTLFVSVYTLFVSIYTYNNDYHLFESIHIIKTIICILSVYNRELHVCKRY